MPWVVKLSGLAGLLLWIPLFAIFGINLMTGPIEGTGPTDPEFDKVAVPIGMALSSAGAAVCAGMLFAKRWAYRVVVFTFGYVVFPIGLVIVSGMDLSAGAAVAGAICISAVLLRRQLVADQVRTFFGLTPRKLSPLTAPGYLSLGFGALTILLLCWPQPTPMFGIWLRPWQDIIINLVFATSNLTLGIGMLRGRRWVWPATIALTLFSIFYMAGYAWGPNPDGRLKPEEATTRQSLARAAALGMMCSSWMLWRVWLYRRGNPQ